MTPLVRHIENRRLAKAGMVNRLLDSGRKLPPSIRRAMMKNLWTYRWSHMRAMAEGVCFSPLGSGAWEIKIHGRRVACSKPFVELVGPVTRPVSIVASGPSAVDYPWDRAMNGERFLIAVNGSPSFLGQLDLRPDLVVVTDSEFIRKSRHHLKNAAGVPLITTHREASILALEAPDELTSRDFTILERVDGWYGVPAIGVAALSELNARSGNPFFFPPPDGVQAKVGWSTRPDLGFFSGRTVTFAALQFAIGLQAKDVEIIGMDLSGQGRSYSEGADVQPSYLQIQYERHIMPSFEIMHRALSGTRIRVRNLSPVCPLPKEWFAA